MAETVLGTGDMVVNKTFPSFTMSPQEAEKEMGSVGESLAWACLPLMPSDRLALLVMQYQGSLGPTRQTSHLWSHFSMCYYSCRGPVIRNLWCPSNCTTCVKSTLSTVYVNPCHTHLICIYLFCFSTESSQSQEALSPGQTKKVAGTIPREGISLPVAS